MSSRRTDHTTRRSPITLRRYRPTVRLYFYGYLETPLRFKERDLYNPCSHFLLFPLELERVTILLKQHPRAEPLTSS